jgi:hypothetical protein
MTLGSNTSVRTTPSTCYKRCKNIISVRLKQTKNDSADSPLNEITQAKRCIYQCHRMSRTHSSNSSTPPPILPQDQPHPHVHKTYGEKGQHAKAPDDSPPLDKAGMKFIQEVTGVFLFLPRAVDSTMLTPLSTLASKQAAPTEKNNAKIPSVFGLCSMAGRCHSYVPGE